MEIKVLNKEDFNDIKDLFVKVFTQEPWNDDWSNKEQLDMYIKELIESFNSLSFGLYDGDNLIGISLGRVMHFYEGTQYRIDELCISRDKQGKGYGSNFMKLIETKCKEMGILYVILTTERNYPAHSFYLKNGFSEAINNVMLYKKTK